MSLQMVQTIAAIALLLMIVDTVLCLVFLVRKRDVIVGHRGADGVMTTLVFLFAVCFCFFYGYQITKIGADGMRVALNMLAGAVFLFVVIGWVFRLVDSIERRMFKVTRSLVSILEERDANLEGDSAHAQRLIEVFYDNLPPEMKRRVNVESLKYAALLHDIGKLGIPQEILDKPGKLTGAEWEIMRRHPELSIEILKPMESFDEILPWIRYHHERVDGSGYYRLSGDEIPLASKMLAIVDTYSAVTIQKSYKPGRSYEDGISTLRLVAGTQLDQELVDIFCAIPQVDVEACALDPDMDTTPLRNRI